MVYFQRKVSGADPSAWSGRSCSAASDELDRLTAKLKVPEITTFVRPGPDIAKSELGGLEPYTADAVNWVDASQGLWTVEALRKHIASKPRSVPKAKAVLAELDELAALLEAASRAKCGFYLSVYFVV